MSQPAAAAPERKVVLTCAQPTGQLTLGNYLGALRHWVTAQDEDAERYFGIVDLHSMTQPYVPAELRQCCYTTLSIYLACGLDPARSHLFLQSQVDGHTELAWILGCLTPIGDLERMTQFKDKSARRGELVGAGLLFYPVLMAADILLYNADAVPVGEDQKQHVELCRSLAQRFNSTYSETFKLPNPVIPAVGARIKSLQEPEKKMSKSDANTQGTLFLLDPPAVLRKKIMSAVTDSGSEVVARDDKPGVTNLLNILSAVTNRPVADFEAEFAGQGYGTFKAAVADAVVALLEPIQQRQAALAKDKAQLDAVFAAGAAAAQRRAHRVLSKVRRKVGLVAKADRAG